MKKSKFAWPLGDAEPGGPSKSTSKRGWIWGLMFRMRSSVPVVISIAEAADDASSTASANREEARSLRAMLSSRIPRVVPRARHHGVRSRKRYNNDANIALGGSQDGGYLTAAPCSTRSRWAVLQPRLNPSIQVQIIPLAIEGL